MAQGHPKFLWWNGRQMPWEDATVHVTDLGWSTVGAIFEGIRAYKTKDGRLAVFRLREHIQRFVDSAHVCLLKMPYTVDQLCEACLDACPSGAITLSRAAEVDAALCTACGACEDVCPNGVFELIEE